MRVHVKTRGGTEETIECECMMEGDNGIYLMSSPSKKFSERIGYVPQDNLEYVEPGDD